MCLNIYCPQCILPEVGSRTARLSGPIHFAGRWRSLVQQSGPHDRHILIVALQLGGHCLCRAADRRRLFDLHWIAKEERGHQSSLGDPDEFRRNGQTESRSRDTPILDAVFAYASFRWVTSGWRTDWPGNVDGGQSGWCRFVRKHTRPTSIDSEINGWEWYRNVICHQMYNF